MLVGGNEIGENYESCILSANAKKAKLISVVFTMFFFFEICENVKLTNFLAVSLKILVCLNSE